MTGNLTFFDEGLMKTFSPLVLCLAAALASAAGSDPRRESRKPDLQADIFTGNCTACHDLALVEEAHRTKTNAEMREILKSHRGRDGFQVTEKDLNRILKLY